MLLNARNCSGKLIWQEKILKVNFELSCAKDGTIKLKFKKIPFRKDVLWLSGLFHRKGRYFEFLQLRGHDNKGNLITSDSVCLTSLGPITDQAGSWICPEVTCMQLRLDSNKPLVFEKITELFLEYSLLGFKCHGRLSGLSDCGFLKIAGSTKIKNYDEVTGVLKINNPLEQNFDLTNWIECCDMSVRSILDILALANGRSVYCLAKQVHFP